MSEGKRPFIPAAKRFFAAPLFPEDKEKTRHAILLNGIINFGLVAMVIVTLGHLLGDNVPTRVSLLNVGSMAIVLAFRWLLRQGYVQLTAVSLISFFFISFTAINLTLGTIRTPTASFYILLVILSRLLLDHRGAILTILLSSLAILGLIFAENAGLLPPPDYSVALTQWITYTALFIIIAFVTNFSLESIQNALAEANTELALRQQAEAALREQESLLRVITDNIQEMIALISLEGVLKFVNPAFQRSLGYEVTALIGQQLSIDLIHPEDVALVQSYLRLARQQERVGELMTFRARHANGRYIWLEASAQYIHDQGGISGLVTVFRDVTAQREAAEQIRLLSRAVEASPVSIVMTDPAGDIIYVNPKFVEVTGFTFAEVRGQNPRILQSGKTPPETHVDMWQTILTGQVWYGEFLNRRKDGSLYWETAVISPITDPATGKITHFIAVKEDITERKQAEAALQRLNKELQERNTELDAFAHTVAHDLKNPVALLIGFSELLLESADTLTPDQIHKSLQNIANNARRANRIIESLLLLSYVPRQEISAEPLAMAQVVQEALARLSADLGAANAEITLPSAAEWPRALGDPAWVEEIWVNYLSNALKYGGRPPIIRLGAATQLDGFVRFSVCDNGPGLTEEQQARLFVPFERLGNKQMDGHGLGLSIVRRIVEKLGGQVGIESAVGCGSVFYFTLPEANAEATAVTTTATPD